MPVARPTETHRMGRVGWLRAAVLGANDGIVSTASLIVGIASASSGRGAIMLAGIAGLVAGAMSMAAGEYISVSSQADTEAADLARERSELAGQPEFELRELTQIYVDRGVSRQTASDVATQLMAHDALAAHAREELGISALTTARPIQAAGASALSFTTGALLPLVVAALAPVERIALGVGLASLAFLALLGATGASVGGAPVGRAIVRVVFWGTVAMVATAVIGRWAGAVV